ncbi:Hypothetical protein PAU_00836 [Photorhabdus asymbiotica]|uniref:Uncharacterized protein n=1 Tax=Photorhabdus asymbiotica subsp. asymbiotica (strain ATCC 43949 / 3105-77) TaxID=553480 RepID=C7BMU2_PHOAA|nr:Hypothetical protein PAU_00836 [Photorhabdus asymbiotica]
MSFMDKPFFLAFIEDESLVTNSFIFREIKIHT